jgi:putative nucleotidyltransferase with HDIG domain
MMRTSMDEADSLAGLRLLVAGGDLSAVQAAQGRLAALGADVTALAGDVDALARAATASPPAAVLAVDGLERPLRERLDPFGLGAGPPVIGLHALIAADEDFGARAAGRLRVLVDRRTLRARQAEFEATVATHALARRRDATAAQDELLQRLLQAAGYRDDNTHEHTQRVATLAARLARELGLGDRQVEEIHRAAPLHDIGKIAIPDSILLKPGRLTADEFEVVKTHAVLGARVLAGGSGVVEVAEVIARHHHERWDGGGYPGGLAGEAIPIAARLVHLADVFDVLLHERPYKDSWTVEAAVEEIERGAGTDFDPAIVRVFKRLGTAELQV